ncbi:hypothetical protein ACMHYB_53565 [Sorangium sp. So ce1128]
MLHVVTSEALRLAALDHIAAAEHLGGNRSPFFVLEAPSDAEDDGWAARVDELREDFAELRHAVSEADGIELPAMPEHAEARTALARFALTVRSALECLRAPLAGLVVVLAPLWARDPARWARDVGALVALRELARVRWVVVDLDEPVCAAVIQAFGHRVEEVDARVNDAAVRAGMDQMLSAMTSAPSGATGAPLSGAAGPRAPAPPRKNAPSFEAHADAATSHQLRMLVLGAAKAMRDGNAAEAVRQQREALRLCVDEGFVRESIVMELVLGGYALQGGARECALGVFEQARQRAQSAGLAELVVQAHLAVAAALLAQHRTLDAALAYARAGETAAAAGASVLAIEAYRMTGQTLAAAGKTELAAKAWLRALLVAGGATAIEKHASTAPRAARALAEHCRQHRLIQQAEALEAQAAEIEAAAPTMESTLPVAAPPHTVDAGGAP